MADPPRGGAAPGLQRAGGEPPSPSLPPSFPQARSMVAAGRRGGGPASGRSSDRAAAGLPWGGAATGRQRGGAARRGRRRGDAADGGRRREQRGRYFFSLFFYFYLFDKKNLTKIFLSEFFYFGCKSFPLQIIFKFIL